jgi:TRAP-type C4-dicarboxylate transport system permease small subunit
MSPKEGPTSPRWRRVVFGLWRLLLAGTMITMTVSVGLGVITRYVFDAPLFWTEEVARYALVWMTFLGSAELFRVRGGHINVEMAVAALPRAWRRAVDLACNLIILLILAAMGVGGYILMTNSRFAVSAALAIPMPWVYAVIPVSAVIAIGALLYQMRQPQTRD